MGVMTSIAIGALIAGTVAKAKAQHSAGKEAKRVGEVNALQAEQQAVDAAQRGSVEESAYRRDVRQMIGQQRTGYAGQNVDVSTGTAAAVQHQTEQLLQSDLARIRRNAEREALGFKKDAEEYRRGGKYAQAAARWGMASTILGGTAETMLATRNAWSQREQDRQRRTSRVPGGGG
jgi:hypothetical protein